MKRKVTLSNMAHRDLEEIWGHMALDLQNQSAATKVIDGILDAIDPLEMFPEMGTPLSSIVDVDSNYRYLIYGKYMIFYYLEADEICVDRIRHGRSNYLRDLFGDIEVPLQ